MRAPTKTAIVRALQKLSFYRLTNPASLQLAPAPAGWTGTAYTACGPCPEHVRQTYDIRVIGQRLHVTIEDHSWAPYGPVVVEATCRLDRQRTRWTVEAGATGQRCRY